VQPSGLAVDGNGDLYVADPGSRTVIAYSQKGEWLRTIGKGRLERPFGLAIDRRRKLLYVVDGGSRTSTRHLVEVFAPDGRHLRTIGTSGNAPGEFAFPSYAAVSPQGNLYVADTLNSRVQVFDPEGNLVTFFGGIGSGPGEFGKVKGLAFDTFGNLHAVDGLHSYVQMFNSKHRVLMGYGEAGREPGLMSLPNGIAIDSKNNIYVADFMNNVVNQYEMYNTTASDSFQRSRDESAPKDAAAPTPDRQKPSVK
jgi:DNA-binding beta-propeller fold protein YncE